MHFDGSPQSGDYRPRPAVIGLLLFRRILVRTGIAVAAFLVAGAFTPASAAEPLLSQGIGTSNCARIVNDIKPNDGLGDPVNLMLYAWVQGYISAANVALLEYDAKHVDMADLTDVKVLGMLQDYCKAHPDKKPANALDAFRALCQDGSGGRLPSPSVGTREAAAPASSSASPRISRSFGSASNASTRSSSVVPVKQTAPLLRI